MYNEILSEDIRLQKEMQEVQNARTALDNTFMPAKLKAKASGDIRKKFMDVAIRLEKLDLAKIILKNILEMPNDQRNNTETIQNIGPRI